MAEEQQAHVGFVDTPQMRQTREKVARLELIADWMDRRYIDPLIGLFFPGAGDTVSSLIGLYAVITAVQMRVHPIVIARMLLNLAIDSLIGSVPLLGWIGDFFYRAHVKNVELVKNRSDSGEATGSDWFIVLLAFGLFLFAISLPLILLVAGIYLLVTTAAG